MKHRAFQKVFAELPEFETKARWQPVDDNGHQNAEENTAAIVSAAMAEGFARGELAGREAAHLEFEAQFVQLEEEFQRRLVQARQQWMSDYSDDVARNVGDIKVQIESALSDHISRIVAPLLKAHLRTTAMNELGMSIDKAIERGARMTIRGPIEALDCIKSKLGGRGQDFEWIATESFEISVQIDDTTIQCAFEEWYSRIEGEVH